MFSDARSYAILTAMITPAVLISACGTLILSTSSRLGRVVDRVRALSDKFDELTHLDHGLDYLEERLSLIFSQMGKLSTRARLLQHALTAFYLATGVFISTSVAIGVVAVVSNRHNWVPVLLGLCGSVLLFYGSILLIFEASVALRSTHDEMDFVLRMGRLQAPEELIARAKSRSKSRRIPLVNRVKFKRPHRDQHND